MDNKYDIFVSYSRTDLNEVKDFLQLLQTRLPDLRCWVDLTGIESGDEFSEKIISAIDDAAFVLFMVSDASMGSPWTKKEVTYAKNTDKRVIPVLLNGAKVKGWFLFEYGMIDSIDTTVPEQVDKLVKNLSEWAGVKSRGHADTKATARSISAASDITIEKAHQLFDEADYSGAVRMYRSLAEQGNPAGQTSLGFCYIKGFGVEPDYAKAAYWYRKAAEQGYAKAQYNLGLSYDNGDGVVKDYAKAVYWYRKAAEQGHAKAQCILGGCYEVGDGVRQDYTQAVYWYRKAAEQGLAKAQYNLGYCYEKGLGVGRDYTRAVYWYRKAAEQGHTDAQNMLAYCYENGFGVAMDCNQANYWYEKARMSKK